MPRPDISNPGKRKATNITLSPVVLADARELGIKISRVCEAHLREVIRQERERRWRDENQEFIRAYNREVTESGLPLAKFRGF